MASTWVLRKDERIFVFKKNIFSEDFNLVEEIEIFEYDTLASYLVHRWRERRAGNSLAYGRGVWDELVQEGFSRWESSTTVTHWEYSG